MSDSLWPHGRQHARLPCPSPIPRAYSNSCPLSWWCHPTISSSAVRFSSHLQSFLASEIFSNESVFHIRWPRYWSFSFSISPSSESVLRMRWPEYWSFSFSISPSKEYSGLIFFRIDWLDVLAVQGTLKSLLQHHSSKASILWHSAFFIVQLSHLYMTTGKAIALTRRTSLCSPSNVSALEYAV